MTLTVSLPAADRDPEGRAVSTALATVLGARQDDPRSIPPFQLIDEDGEPTALGVSIGINLNLAQ
jgi:hypothetical protein